MSSWRNTVGLHAFSFSTNSHLTWPDHCYSTCEVWKNNKSPPSVPSSLQPLVAQNSISSHLSDKLDLYLPSKRWFMKPKRLLNIQSISPQTNDGHSGPKPYWLMTDAMRSDRCAAKNTITTLLWLRRRVSVQISWLWCWWMDMRQQWWMLLEGGASV